MNNTNFLENKTFKRKKNRHEILSTRNVKKLRIDEKVTINYYRITHITC